jgi:hypothetical protein
VEKNKYFKELEKCFDDTLAICMPDQFYYRQRHLLQALAAYIIDRDKNEEETSNNYEILRVKFDDFDKVMTQENLDKFQKINYDLCRSLEEEENLLIKFMVVYYSIKFFSKEKNC